MNEEFHSKINPIRDDLQENNGLIHRYIFVDGNNVAMKHGRDEFFSAKGLKLAINELEEKSKIFGIHPDIKVLLPQFRKYSKTTQDQQILDEIKDYLIYIDSRADDDSYILDFAIKKNGLIMSNDCFKDHKQEFYSYASKNQIRYLFIDDSISLNEKPSGIDGPSLEDIFKGTRTNRARSNSARRQSKPQNNNKHYKPKQYQLNSSLLPASHSNGIKQPPINIQTATSPMQSTISNQNFQRLCIGTSQINQNNFEVFLKRDNKILINRIDIYRNDLKFKEDGSITHNCIQGFQFYKDNELINSCGFFETNKYRHQTLLLNDDVTIKGVKIKHGHFIDGLIFECIKRNEPLSESMIFGDGQPNLYQSKIETPSNMNVVGIYGSTTMFKKLSKGINTFGFIFEENQLSNDPIIQHTLSNPIVEKLVILTNQKGQIIGKNGSRINKIREDSQATIFIKDNPDNDKESFITVSGNKMEVEKAKSLLNKLIINATMIWNSSEVGEKIDKSNIIQVGKNTEINILLLGETGVGKSTFINALINYLTYETLKEAENGELAYCIPSKFVITDNNFQQKIIRVGDKADTNEHENIVESQTQYAKSYLLKLSENFKIRLIDTPGIGDTRGLDKDKENFQYTLNYISKYKYLNAICILLKPDVSKLSIPFKYCIKELLVHLHKDSAKNMLFCFTNSRSSFYTPGDTIMPLKSLLEEIKNASNVEINLTNENVFCFDSESFRLLAALKDGIYFSEKQKDDYSNSWKVSVETALKMIKYIKNLPIHNVDDTISLNEARRIISELSKPIAEISQNIQLNMKLIEDKKYELEKNGHNMKDLEKRLNIPVVDLEIENLDYPTTVCTNSDCVQYINVEGNIKKCDYKTVCHSRCYLKGVVTNTINTSQLRNCSAMNQLGDCDTCKCKWDMHMHITYKTKLKKRNMIDQNTAELIKSKTQKSDKIKAIIDRCNERLTKLQYEQMKINEISAKFAFFAENKSILVFNDDLENFLDLLIREEKGKLATCDENDTRILDGLVKTKNEYLYQKKLYNDAFEQGRANQNDSIVNLNNINELKKELFDLPIKGNELQKMIEDININKQKIDKTNETSIRLGVVKTTTIFKNIINYYFK